MRAVSDRVKCTSPNTPVWAEGGTFSAGGASVRSCRRADVARGGWQAIVVHGCPQVGAYEAVPSAFHTPVFGQRC